MQSRTVEDLIKAVGGRKAAAGLTGSGGYAPYKWPKIGIPEKHWPVFIEHAGASPDEIFAANQRARAASKEKGEAA
jgi:hypothetical protein